VRVVCLAWLAASLASSFAPAPAPAPASRSLPLWTGQWEIVADPLTARGLAGLPDSICGSACTIRETKRGLSIDRLSVFDLALPGELIPGQPGQAAAGSSGWQVTRTADALTVTGFDPATGDGSQHPATRYVLAVRGEFLQVEMTRLTGTAPPTFTPLYRRAYTQPDR
jgi:hypothetical protein